MKSLARNLLCLAILGALLAHAPAAFAWSDGNGNKIDDQIEAVDQNGIATAFENNDINQRMLIAVFDLPALEYGVYVGYDHHPTLADETALQLAAGAGAPVKTYASIDYTRTQATYAEIQTIAALPGVTRVESIPMMYPTNHVGSRVVRARDSRGLRSSEDFVLFPSTRADMGLDGTGVVVGILDTGVNDEADGITPYAGHESLSGKFLGGGEFYAGDPLLNTPTNQSVNPKDRGPDTWHGTHVAGSAIGNGGQTGFFSGVAPAARLVDCKVLSDAGVGFGSADGVDWCIVNMNNDWGLTGPDLIYSGIDVLNLSLGCLDCSGDGTTASELIIDAAVDAGLIVCIATGNDDAINQIGSPASADKSIAVGAAATQGSLTRTDDAVTSFSNEGPRASDGDADLFDEYKPAVVGPGAGIISANGDPYTTSGEAYHTLSGTSMSTPHVAGVCALLRQADPAIDGMTVRSILQNTAIHHLPSEKGFRAPDPSGIDSNYSPMSGWGMVDAYAAAKEVMNSTSGAQVVRIRAIPRPLDGEIDVLWWSQREYTFDGYNVHRAPDVGGSPGVYSQVNVGLIAPVGDPVIEDDGNRTPYAFVDNDPALTLGQAYWYQIEWVESGVGTLEPAIPVEFGEQPPVATVFYSIKHNAPDNDLFVRIGTSSSYDPDGAQYFTLGEGEGATDEIILHEPANAGTATTGYLEHLWSRTFFVADGVQGFLPPSQGSPWFLDVADAGFINRTGTVESFSMFVNDSPGSSSGTTYVTDSIVPSPTLDQFVVPGFTATLWIPEQTPVATTVLRMNAEGMDGAVRIGLDLSEPSPGSRAHVARGLTHDFAARTVLTGEPIEFDGTRFEYVDREVVPGTAYWYWVRLEQADGRVIMNGPVNAKAKGTTLTFLAAPQPNPVSSSSSVAYAIGADQASNGAVPVSITLHDARGRKVRTLKQGSASAGRYNVHWDGADETGLPVSRGVYYVQFRAGNHTSSSKLVVVR